VPENKSDSINSERQRNREQFPEITALLDSLGENRQYAKVLHIQTPDYSLGTRPNDALISPQFAAWDDNWCRINGVKHEGSQGTAGSHAAKSRPGKAAAK